MYKLHKNNCLRILNERSLIDEKNMIKEIKKRSSEFNMAAQQEKLIFFISTIKLTYICLPDQNFVIVSYFHTILAAKIKIKIKKTKIKAKIKRCWTQKKTIYFR